MITISYETIEMIYSKIEETFGKILSKLDRSSSLSNLTDTEHNLKVISYTNRLIIQNSADFSSDYDIIDRIKFSIEEQIFDKSSREYLPKKTIQKRIYLIKYL